MLRPRIIPVLLLKGNGLVKTIRFKSPAYIGDPMNAVKIFNDKGADELVLINLDASDSGKPMDTLRLQEIVSEAFMPVSYGGGIKSLKHIEQVITCGVEKVVVNSAAIVDSNFLSQASKEFGSSTLSVSVDYKTGWWNKMNVYSNRATVSSKYSPTDYCKMMEDNGAGEIFLHSVDRDGTMSGYDLKLLDKICKSINIPVVICGGASSYKNISEAIATAASGAAAGSLFVYSGEHKAVLINYPDENWRRNNLSATK